QLAIRAQELSATIDLLLQHETFKASIDAQQIGLLGFGTGGSAALLLAGAAPDCISWPDYCPTAGKEDIYCNPWSREKINDICVFFPLKKKLTDPRIKIFCAISPGFGMLFSPRSFTHVNKPLLIVGLGLDRLNVSQFHAEKMMAQLRGKAKFISIANADLSALMAPCPASLEKELPELCRSVDAKERSLIHKRLWEILVNFLDDQFSTQLPTIQKTP
ncbi:MAG: hypothetical protein IK079_05335, partial [Desulfovibrio sp.]|nr:hypothetical protein [Desulfovibrio sp.]